MKPEDEITGRRYATTDLGPLEVTARMAPPDPARLEWVAELLAQAKDTSDVPWTLE